MTDTITCKRCGIVVRRKRLAQKYCSKACANAATKQRSRQRSGDMDGAATTLLGSGDVARENTNEINELAGPISEGYDKWPQEYRNPLHGTNQDGSTPGALQGDDFPIELDANGFPELPACLDRRQLKLRRAA
jgi:hypothetical protein